MKYKKIPLLITALGLPYTGFCQSVSGNMPGLHPILANLYEEMMPLCAKLIGVSQGIAALATLIYIASRIWKHIAQAEAIEVYPLLRPFAIGMCIALFPSLLHLINGVMNPVVDATSQMAGDSNIAIKRLLEQKAASIKQSRNWQMYVGMSGDGDRDRWYRYTYDEDPASEGIMEGIGNDIEFEMAKLSYGFRASVKQWMSEVLEVLYQAASLCINTLRTFNLVVLSILGPLVFALSVFDGLHHTLKAWIARYLNTFLWLPVANIFGSIIGKVQEQMLLFDIEQISQESTTLFSSTDAAYLVFLIIGIVGYFTVPSVASYIVHAGGGGAMTQKVNNLFGSTIRSSYQSAVDAGRDVLTGAGRQMGKAGAYMRHRITGK